MHAEQPAQTRVATAPRGRRSILAMGAALAAAAALLIPTLANAADLDVNSEATFEAGATTYTVPSAALGSAGFLVVREGTQTEFAGVIGASALLQAGTHSDVSVALNREVEDGEYLWVMAHADTNANGTFDGPDVDLGVSDSVNGNLTLTGALEGLLAFPVLANVNVQAGDGAFQGDLAASGVSLVLFAGTTVDGLVQAAQAENVISVAATVDGEFVVYIVGAPAFVNAQFNTVFAGGLEANTPLAVTR